MTNWITTAEAAKRLGVKPATLYAYVSRGVLQRRSADDGRSSLFDPAEVGRLATRGRPRRTCATELVIESGVTAIIDGRPYYRARDVMRLAAEHGFEEVAAFLWTGELIEQPSWTAAPHGVAAARAAQSGLPAETLPLERLQVTVAALAATDPLRLQLDPAAVAAAGQNLVAGMVAALPQPQRRTGRKRERRDDDDAIAARLWRTLCPTMPSPKQVDALRAALVLLADHELAASTLAARVAASVRADPYAVVAAGLGVVGGALHGGAALGAEAMLSEARDPQDVSRVVGERLRRGERIPGFGHFVYKAGDPRAIYLLDLLRRIGSDSARLGVADALISEVVRRGLPPPNIDFALAALVSMTGMVKGASEAIFAIARTAGWIGHAIEEYAHGTPLRPRAVYTGPLPRRAHP